MYFYEKFEFLLTSSYFLLCFKVLLHQLLLSLRIAFKRKNRKATMAFILPFSCQSKALSSFSLPKQAKFRQETDVASPKTFELLFLPFYLFSLRNPMLTFSLHSCELEFEDNFSFLETKLIFFVHDAIEYYIIVTNEPKNLQSYKLVENEMFHPV